MLENYEEGYKLKDWHGELIRERGISRREADKILRKLVPDESHFQTKIINGIRDAFPNSYVVKISQGAYSTGGIPDILCVIGGQYFGFEVKRPVFGKATRLQEKAISKINNVAGGAAAVVTYPEEALEVIKKNLRNGEGKQYGTGI